MKKLKIIIPVIITIVVIAIVVIAIVVIGNNKVLSTKDCIGTWKIKNIKNYDIQTMILYEGRNR